MGEFFAVSFASPSYTCVARDTALWSTLWQCAVATGWQNLWSACYLEVDGGLVVCSGREHLQAVRWNVCTKWNHDRLRTRSNAVIASFAVKLGAAANTVQVGALSSISILDTAASSTRRARVMCCSQCVQGHACFKQTQYYVV